MMSVWKRELRQYLLTPTGYVFAAIFWLLSAAFFFLYNVLRGTSDLSELFGNLSYLFMMIMPLLTMRLFSLERSRKTDQLFYCTPVSLPAVVWGKFFAAVSMVIVVLAGTGVYVGILASRATLQIGRVASCYMGFVLLCGAQISVGVLMSAVTDSQITAAVLTFAANMLFQLAEMAGPSLHVPYMPFLPGLLRLFSLNTRYARFVAGVVTPADLGYFVVFTGAALALTVYLLRRRQLARRSCV